MPNGNSLAENETGEAEDPSRPSERRELLLKRFTFYFPAALGLGKGHSPFLLV